MKSIRTWLILPAILVAACNHSRTQSVTVSSPDGKTKVAVDLGAVETSTDQVQEKLEKLKKLTPLSTDQLKTMLPDEIAGMKRSSFNANSMMGFATAEATYQNEGDDKEISVSIFDCAGEAGAGIYSLNYWTKMSMQSESDNGYTKTVEFNGEKALETYEKSSDNYELTFVASDRLLVNIKGQKTGLDEVHKAAESLKLKVD
jgi:hypothetical protein